MKKAILILFTAISISSCKKEETIVEPQTENKVFFRVESVSKTGESTFSEVEVLTVK